MVPREQKKLGEERSGEEGDREKENGRTVESERRDERREVVGTRDNLFAPSVVQRDKKSYLYREEASV